MIGSPKLVWRFEMQHELEHFDIFSDANWASCRRSRKSTPGGAITMVTHLVASWSKTRATTIKSSAESELCGIVRATCESIGFITLLEDLGSSGNARLHIPVAAISAQGLIDR